MGVGAGAGAGGLGEDPPTTPKIGLSPSMSPPIVLTPKCQFCNFHTVFGHFVQIAPHQLTPFGKPCFGAIDVKMDGSVLEGKSSFKRLGLSFSSKLDWESFIIFIAKAANKKIEALIQGVPYCGGWGGGSPPTSQKFAHSSQSGKILPSRPLPTNFLSPHQRLIPPPNNNFHVTTQEKLHF